MSESADVAVVGSVALRQQTAGTGVRGSRPATEVIAIARLHRPELVSVRKLAVNSQLRRDFTSHAER